MKDYKQIFINDDTFSRMFSESALWQLIVDHRGKIVLANKSICDGLGVGTKELIGEKFEILCGKNEEIQKTSLDLVKRITNKKEEILSVPFLLHTDSSEITTQMTITQFTL